MPRAIESDVRSITETDSTICLDPFIAVASRYLDAIVAACSDASDLTSDQLRDIETYLAAHFYSLRDKEIQSERSADASASYRGKSGMGLDGTSFGQMAKMLDTSGCLDKFDKRPRAKASLSWLGKPPSEQIDYDQRD